MNKEFIKKMLLAKQLEYEALKEIMPQGMRRQVEELESSAKEVVKELAMDSFIGMQGGSSVKRNVTNENVKHTSKVAVVFDEEAHATKGLSGGDDGKLEAGSVHDATAKKQARKINVAY